MVKISVTQSHIYRGVQQSTHSCPIALALREAFDEYDWEVGGDFIERYTLSMDKQWTFDISNQPKIIQFVEDFDVKGIEAVHPFEFELPEPELVWQATDDDGPTTNV